MIQTHELLYFFIPKFHLLSYNENYFMLTFNLKQALSLL
jgi:hypothetical protein